MTNKQNSINDENSVLLKMKALCEAQEKLDTKLKKKNVYPLIISIATSLTTGILTFLITYFSLSYKHNLEIAQTIQNQNFALKKETYIHFVRSITSAEDKFGVYQLINIGSLEESVATDGEIQALEDKFQETRDKLYDFDVDIALQAALAELLVGGSLEVRTIAEDIMKVFHRQEYHIDLSRYSKDFQKSYEEWEQIQQDGVAYGWEEKISGYERFRIIILSKLFSLLLEQMNQEVAAVASGE